eukprot:6419462-Alexandrium_andersonii.AAC.1
MYGMYRGLGLHTNIGKERVQRCLERHTNRYGPGGATIEEAWVDAEVAHQDAAALINRCAP